MSDRNFWIGAARRLALRRNIAFWLDAFLSVSLFMTVLAAVILLAFRVLGINARPFWFGWVAALLVMAVGCALLAARKPFRLVDALSRLDEVGKFRNRLISAFEGIGPWPAPLPGIRDSVQWNWGRFATPLLIGGVLLGVVSMIEIPRFSAHAPATEPPIAWAQLDSWIKTLDQAKLLDQPALDKLKEQVDDLRHQPRQDWYSQNSLEAGDALQQRTSQTLKDLETALQKGADLVGQARQGNQMASTQVQMLTQSMHEALATMVSGNLPLNKELAGQLRSFDPSHLKSLSDAQMKALQQRLANGEKICSQCVGPRATQPGSAKRGQFSSGHPGGGGPAPLGLDQNAENLHTKHLENASNVDPSRALPGEVVAIAKGKHAIDKNVPVAPVSGGAISSAGEGGDAVWRESLTPDERQVLQKYFK